MGEAHNGWWSWVDALFPQPARLSHLCACVCVLPCTFLCVVTLFCSHSPFTPFILWAGTFIVTSPARSITRSQPITLTHTALFRRHAPSTQQHPAHRCSTLVCDLVHPCERMEKSVPLHKGVGGRCLTFSNWRWNYWFKDQFEALFDHVGAAGSFWCTAGERTISGYKMWTFFWEFCLFVC